MRDKVTRCCLFLAVMMTCAAVAEYVAHAATGTSTPAATTQKKGVAGETKKAGGTAGSASDKDAMLALAKKSGCLACHAMDKKLVGPSWVDVAARYKGDAKAKATLIEKVKKEGKGNWTKVTGGVPMPPNSPKVSDADIEKLVNFVLSMAK